MSAEKKTTETTTTPVEAPETTEAANTAYESLVRQVESESMPKLSEGPSNEIPMGFEDEEAGDMIIPRIKIVNALSPERKEKIADEGDIIDSLTKAKFNGKVFIPVFKFNNNIEWRDRSEGGGIKCIARDGKVGVASDGTTIMCAGCRRCDFDNSKQGKEAIPKCTRYINFFGFFEGDRTPIILSFAKTNYKEGKKLYSLAKITMQNMWNFGYVLNGKLMANAGNEWYNIITAPNGPTSEEDRAFGMELYKSFRNNVATMQYDMDDNASETSSGPSIDIDVDGSTEF